MRKLTFLLALLCASVMGWAATQYCGETSSNDKFTFSLMNVSGNTYRIQFDAIGGADDKITGINLVNIGVNQSAGAGIALSSGWVVTADRAYVEFTTASESSVPTNFYTWAIFFGRAGGEENVINSDTPTDIDWTATCSSDETKTDPELSITSTEVTLDASISETFQITATTATGYDGTITYESSNEGIASVDDASGLVTAVGRGTATITVTAPETDTFAKSTKKLTVTVTGPINWEAVSWLQNSDKYKVVVDPEISSTYGGIRKEGDNLWIGFPVASFGAMSIESNGGTGAAKTFALSNFTQQFNQFTVECGGTTYTFDVFYAEGTTGGGSDPEPTEIYDVNFALQSQGGVASAKSGNAAGEANDGNIDSRWWSSTDAPMTDAEKNDQWWQVDLGQRRIFNTIQIVWEGAWGKSFDIQISNDGDAWTTVKEIRNQNIPGPFPYEQTIDLETNKTARYVRFQGVERGTQWAYSFWEFRVLLPGVSVLTSIDLTAPAQIAEVGGAGVALTAQPKDQNGQNMEAEISWEITPAAAGHMSGNTFIPDQVGSASIRAYSGDVYSAAVTIAAYEGTNVALNKTDDEITVSGYDTTDNLFPRFAVDDNDGSLWSAFHGETGSERIYDAWISVDLGAYYDINLIAIRWEAACSRHYHVDFSADNFAWRTAYNAGWNAVATHWEYLIGTAEDATKVRYVRVWSTEAVSQYGTKIMALKVYGIPWVPSGDTEAPVMGEASLVSNTYTEAVLSVAATDNVEVARFHVVDNANGIDANYVANAGQITITGLTDATDYNFTITAIDAAGLESENSAVVPVSIPFNTEANLALNKPCEGGYYDNNPVESAEKANDGDNGTSWVTYGDHAIALDWWVVDLGNVYNLTNITALWANDAYATAYMLQARVEAPTAADKANDDAWVTLANVSGVTAGEEKSTDVSGVGRYVRFRATAHTGFFRLREFRVYASGVATVDTEAPVMTSASLVSSADTYAVIAVAATDDQGVANYHVVDAGNSFNANCIAEGGNITVTGLVGGTAYNLIITAIDYFGNESANSKSVEVTTIAHYTEPQTAAPVPAWPAEQVKSLYSNTYAFAPASLNSYNEPWWSLPALEEGNVDGNTYLHYNLAADGMIGWQFAEISVALMEKLHIDIFSSGSGTLTIRPITTEGPEVRKTLTLVGQQWNSFDIALTEFPGHDWTKLFQFAIEYWNAGGLTGEHISVDNVYFYRETAIEDNEDPTDFTASLAGVNYFSVKINAQASDNNGAVIFTVKNGDDVVATQNAASAAATVINVNGLNAGTAYNLNVYVADEAGNALEPIVVAATTLALPGAAPAPTHNAKAVKSIYSETYESAIPVAINFNEWWWQSPTIAQEVSLGGNNARYYGGLSANGVFGITWSGDYKLDAAGYQKVHFHIYPTNSATIEIYPVIAPEGEFHKVSQELVGGQWNEVVLDYSEKTFAPFNQFGVAYTAALGDFFIDNLYFFSDPDYSRDGLTVGNYGTICLPQAGEIVGATLYEIADYANGMIYVDEVEGGVMEAGKPYIFQATSDKLDVYYTSAVVAETAGKNNGLYGFYNLTNSTATLTLDDNASLGNYILYQNQYWLVSGRAAYIANYHAYIKIGEINYVAPAPGRRRVAMNVNGEQTATGINELNAAEAPVKMIMNGQLYILRGEKLYDATGRLVK